MKMKIDTRLKPITRFGMAIKAERKRAGLTQDALAKNSGMHRTYIGVVERGEKSMTLDSMLNVANGLGTTLAELVKVARL